MSTLVIGDDLYTTNELLTAVDDGEISKEDAANALLESIHDGEKWIKQTEGEIQEVQRQLEEGYRWKRQDIRAYEYITGEEW